MTGTRETSASVPRVRAHDHHSSGVNEGTNFISELADTMTCLSQELHKADQFDIERAACRAQVQYSNVTPPRRSDAAAVRAPGSRLVAWTRVSYCAVRSGRAKALDLLVISHPCVVPVNRAIYQRMAQDGCSLAIGVPARWRNEFHGGSFTPVPLPGPDPALFTLPILFPGRPQRHLYLVNPRSILKTYRPSTLFIEAEAFSFSALQWGAAARSLRIPFGVQAAENLDRPLPAPVVAYRKWLLTHASFVAARSVAAGERAREWGARGDIVLVPHAVPLWNVSRIPSGVFTIGYAGRLVPEKGITDLVDAFLRMTVSAELVLFGDGPLRPGIERGSSRIKVVADLTHERMAEAYAAIDLLVLPSRSTPTWEEQFGRVLVEALSCGVPVLGSDSGEIPWVIRTTGGGEVFPEGDVTALASLLDDLADDGDRRTQLANRGGEAVRRLFSVEVVARNMREVVDAAARR